MDRCTKFLSILAKDKLSFVHVAPVCNARDTDELCVVVDDINHAPVTNPYAPKILVPFQLLAAHWSWRLAQGGYPLDDTGITVSGIALSSFRAEGLTSTE